MFVIFFIVQISKHVLSLLLLLLKGITIVTAIAATSCDHETIIKSLS